MLSSQKQAGSVCWWCMVFNATFNNISVISLLAVLLVDKTGVPRETTDLSQVTLSYKVVSSTTSYERGSNSQF